ncbi:MAG: SsrA-binding protein SmpB [Desulfohalobiaceae bacterium]|nr:SsrA-binding protein SmpB [Desulfohalobiaceae bacterium]
MATKKKKVKQDEQNRIVARNKKVPRIFEILETLEAGLSLTGSEVKSVRAGRVSFKDSFVYFRKGEAYLTGVHIARYENAVYFGHDPERDRKLLLHKREIEAWRGRSEQKGLTVVPTKIYLRNGLAKVELALAKGKRIHDRREDIKRKTVERETAREIARHRK